MKGEKNSTPLDFILPRPLGLISNMIYEHEYELAWLSTSTSSDYKKTCEKFKWLNIWIYLLILLWECKEQKQL
jgi:hypothetical protein